MTAMIGASRLIPPCLGIATDVDTSGIARKGHAPDPLTGRPHRLGLRHGMVQTGLIQTGLIAGRHLGTGFGAGSAEQKHAHNRNKSCPFGQVSLKFHQLSLLRGRSYSALVYLTQRLLWPMTRLADMTDLYQRAMASVDRVMDLLEITPAADGTVVVKAPACGALAFDAVGFAYGATPVLLSVSLNIPAGATIALVGGTGSGKSTLIKLALGFIEAQSGEIRFDGEDLRTLAKSQLRAAIGYVAQEPFLTDGSVAENIAYGQITDPVQVREAAIAAEAHSFITALPNGYDSPVGERGSLLSGGQRQRIALARALYKNPALLILDEATSAVDNETEAAIQRSLTRLNHSRSCLIVAHRLSTVRDADEIIVLDRGVVVERGTHQELLAVGGRYRDLYNRQYQLEQDQFINPGEEIAATG